MRLKRRPNPPTPAQAFVVGVLLSESVCYLAIDRYRLADHRRNHEQQ